MLVFQAGPPLTTSTTRMLSMNTTTFILPPDRPRPLFLFYRLSRVRGQKWECPESSGARSAAVAGTVGATAAPRCVSLCVCVWGCATPLRTSFLRCVQGGAGVRPEIGEVEGWWRWTGGWGGVLMWLWGVDMLYIDREVPTGQQEVCSAYLLLKMVALLTKSTSSFFCFSEGGVVR